MSASAVDDNVWPGLLPAIATKVGGRRLLALALVCACVFARDAAAQPPPVPGDAVDVSQDFYTSARVRVRLVKDGRCVYLAPGEWVEYQAGELHAGERRRRIKAGPIPVVLLVRNHAAVPHILVAQSTADIDWRNVELRVFSTDDAPADGLFAPPDGVVQTLNLEGSAGAYALQADPLRGRVNWRVTRFPVR